MARTGSVYDNLSGEATGAVGGKRAVAGDTRGVTSASPVGQERGGRATEALRGGWARTGDTTGRTIVARVGRRVSVLVEWAVCSAFGAVEGKVGRT